MRMIAADGPWAKTLLPIAKTRPFNETMEDLYASPQSDLRRRRHLGDDLSPRDAERRGDRRVDGSDEPRALPERRWTKPDRRKFLDRYTAELRQAYPVLPDGCVLLRSRRLFILAQP